MTYSIIIAHDPKRDNVFLDRCLATLPEGEILVASEGNKSESRNNAADKAHGEILIFFDDDVALRHNCISELLEPFIDDMVGIVGGVNLQFPGCSWREQVSSVLLASNVSMFKSAARYTPRGILRQCDESEILSCVMAVRKKAFEEAGGFPADVIPCEENVLINRIQGLGYKVLYNPFAIVYHRRPKMFLEYWRTIYSYGYGRGIMIRRREGKPKMFWKPSSRWLLYGVGLVGHYSSYIFGVAKGFIDSGKTPLTTLKIFLEEDLKQ